MKIITTSPCIVAAALLGLAGCEDTRHIPATAGCPDPAVSEAGSWGVEVAYPSLSLVDPISMWFEPDGEHFMVASARGTLHRYQRSGDPASRQLVLDISERVQRRPDDGGLKSFALHPQYGKQGAPGRSYIYIHYRYTPTPGNDGPIGYNRVSRFTVHETDATATAASEQVLIQQFDRHHWHDGGDMAFGPDGFLYISTGDEGLDDDHFNSVGRLDQGLFGGILRIDVDNDPDRSHPIRRRPLTQQPPPPGWPPSITRHYSIPNDNPWLDPNGAVLEEFWAYGLRSPHRLSIDPVTGVVWTGDVGGFRFEEINQVVAGGNYQWPFTEGTEPGPRERPAEMIGTERPPLWHYGRGDGMAIIGGHVYRGNRLHRYLCGQYLFADHMTGNIWALRETADAPVEVNLLTRMPGSGYGTGISSFAVDSAGEVFMLKWNGFNRDGGRIYRLVPPAG